MENIIKSRLSVFANYNLTDLHAPQGISITVFYFYHVSTSSSWADAISIAGRYRIN